MREGSLRSEGQVNGERMIITMASTVHSHCSSALDSLLSIEKTIMAVTTMQAARKRNVIQGDESVEEGKKKQKTHPIKENV